LARFRFGSFVRRLRRLGVAGAASLVIVVGAAACGPGAEGKFGQELYEHSCASCHGSDLQGWIGPPLGPGSGAVELTDEQLAGATRIGPGAMPGFARLTDEQIESLVEYLRLRQQE